RPRAARGPRARGRAAPPRRSAARPAARRPAGRPPGGRVAPTGRTPAPAPGDPCGPARAARSAAAPSRPAGTVDGREQLVDERRDVEGLTGGRGPRGAVAARGADDRRRRGVAVAE